MKKGGGGSSFGRQGDGRVRDLRFAGGDAVLDLGFASKGFTTPEYQGVIEVIDHSNGLFSGMTYAMPLKKAQGE